MVLVVQGVCRVQIGHKTIEDEGASYYGKSQDSMRKIRKY